MRSRRRLAFAVCAAIAPLAAHRAAAQGVTQPAAPSPAAARPASPPAAPPVADGAPSAYQLNLLYTGELWENAMGGIRRGDSYMQNADAQLRVDAGQAFGWTGGRFYLEGFYENKTSTGSQYVGAVDQQSPIDTAGFSMLRLYQAYYDQALGDTDILFGIYDLETEFSATKPMALFLSKDLTWNTALDQSGTMPQNGVVGPGNYPYTPLALRLRERFDDRWSAQVAIADGVADNPNHQSANGIFFSARTGLLGIGEVDYAPVATTKIMAGLWGLTSRLPSNVSAAANGSPGQTPGQIQGEAGGYLGGATRLYSQSARRGLDGFFTLGLSTAASTNTSKSLNGGLVYTGLFDARPRDKIGVSFNVNVNPASYRAAQISQGISVVDSEASFEATYRAKITDWLTVQPDLQYIVHPGYVANRRNDLIVGLHFEIGHLFNL